MKWLYDHIEYLLIFIVAGLLLFFSFRQNPPILSSNDYSKTFFDDSFVHRVEIFLPENDFAQILENPIEKIKYHADIKIDGEIVKDISISTRGNATLYSGAELEDFDAYSYKIDFNKWHKHQTFRGLDSFYLNNFFADSSYLKNYLSFRLMRSAGVAAPLASYTEVYINDELKGFYLAIEGYDQSYLTRTGASPGVALWKPEPLAHDRSAFTEFATANPELANSVVLDIFHDEYDSEGADLVYRNDSPDSYPGIFRNNLTPVSLEQQRFVISAIKSLTFDSPANIAQVWDIDGFARYAAAHNFIINGDSYIGFIPHNYILRLDSGRLTLLPWDYDLAAEVTWQTDIYPDIATTAKIPFDQPVLGTSPEKRPLWTRLMGLPDFVSKYQAEMRNLITTEFSSGQVFSDLEEKYELIKNYVLEDPGRRFDMSEFESSVNSLRSFLVLRAESISDEISNREILTSLNLRSAPVEL